MDGAGNGRNGCFDRTNRSQGNEGDPMGEVSPVLLGSLQRQARLADAARTYQADAPALRVGDEPVQVNQLLLSSKKGRQRYGQVVDGGSWTWRRAIHPSS